MIQKESSQTKAILPMTGNKSSKALNCYVEFEPFSKWQHKDEVDILEIHLPEFKKEQLKVQISNTRVLKIYGERPIDSSRKLKFYKEIPLSTTYEASAANAKLVKGWLYITIPKSKNMSSLGQEKSSREAPETPKQVVEPPSNLQTVGDVDDDAMCELRGHDRESSICLRLAKMTVTMVVVVASLAGLLAFVDYGYKSIAIGVDECMADCMDLMRVI